MCHTEDVFHAPCRHWGRERFIGGPCCRSRIVNGRHTGCGYIEKIGAVNSNELCFDCKFRLARGPGWKPFAYVSNDGWAKVEEKIRQRSVGSDDFLYPRNGESPVPIQKRNFSSLAQGLMLVQTVTSDGLAIGRECGHFGIAIEVMLQKHFLTLKRRKGIRMKCS
jgi:hypothetical protein